MYYLDFLSCTPLQTECNRLKHTGQNNGNMEYMEYVESNGNEILNNNIRPKILRESSSFSI